MSDILPRLTSATLSAIPSIRHGFFTRQGGDSTGIYASLNCGLGTSDNPQTVAANRALVAQAIGVEPGRLVTAYQCHSAVALIVDAPFATIPQVDALVTTTPGLAIGVLAADCGPILFAARDGGVVAAAHAGWKGALTGIIESTVAAMEQCGAKRDGISAVLGPCISQASYQVGPEFRDNFLTHDESLSGFFASDEGNFRFDLGGFIRLRLEQACIGAIDHLAQDTYSDPERFFSYRRTTHAGESDYGRQVSAIAIGSPA